jgi:RNA methyltransferase, TrmH family
MNQDIINTFSVARKGQQNTVLVEGFHAVKHALRFGAEFEVVYATQNGLGGITASTAADPATVAYIRTYGQLVTEAEFCTLAPHSLYTGVCGLAKKSRPTNPSEMSKVPGMTVVLENPRKHDNVGAVVRVCAAKGVSGLVVTGDTSLWHAHSIRSAAGLQWAVPVFQDPSNDFLNMYSHRKLYACTDEGENMYTANIDLDPVFVFGTERAGLTLSVRENAFKKISIPMQENVSSMNLATSVSAVLFATK